MGSQYIGTLLEFDDTKDEWVEYLERMEHFFSANEITDDNKKKAIMLSSCGGKTYKLFRNLLAPVKPGDAIWQTLREQMSAHQHPKPSAIAERFRFNKRDRKSGESISSYVAELRRLSEHCEYGNNLNDMMRDRLVCGVQNVRIQQKLLAETTLTFETAFKTASAMERAHSEALDLQNEPGQDTAIKINKFESPTQLDKKKQDGKTCYRCGGKHGDKCPFREAECFKCRKTGHISKVCRSGKVKPPKNTTHRMEGEETHIYESTESINDEDTFVNMLNMYHYEASKNKVKPIIVNPIVNNVRISMEVDTGASLSVINEQVLEDIKKVDSKLVLQKTNVIFKSYSGEPITPLGKIKVCVQYDNQMEYLELYVIKGRNKTNLMGRDWLHRIRINWQEIFSIIKWNKIITVS